jgi:hypothetical protein
MVKSCRACCGLTSPNQGVSRSEPAPVLWELEYCAQPAELSMCHQLQPTRHCWRAIPLFSAGVRCVQACAAKEQRRPHERYCSGWPWDALLGRQATGGQVGFMIRVGGVNWFGFYSTRIARCACLFSKLKAGLGACELCEQ